jgi:hypothetical protein
MKVQSKRHAPSQNSMGTRGMHSACCRCSLRQCERVELPLEVMTLDVVAPLVQTLDGDVTIFPIPTVGEFVLEVGCSYTCHWYTWCCWGTCCWWCMCDWPIRTKTWWLTWNKVRPCLVRLSWLLFSSKQQRRVKQLSKTKKTSRCKKREVFYWLLAFGAFTFGFYTNLTQPTSILVQLLL